MQMLSEVVKKGYLNKQSRYLKKWRRRYVVLYTDRLETFENETKEGNPTEVIFLNQCSSIQSANDVSTSYCLMIVCQGTEFLFQCESQKQKEDWIAVLSRFISQTHTWR